jgi:hypothetical protein
VLACFTFVAAYGGAFVYQQRFLPPIVDDALTYHLPAAVQWLQTGRIELFPTWFFNPANTFSPLGGSIFMTWLIAPTGNDVLVRFVQLGPLLLLFLVVLEIARLLGARNATAALIALACVMTRSFINQVVVPKDDLFLTVFCVLAVMSLAPGRADETWAPFRAGGAIGLLLAMKYTAAFSLPILLLMIDVPFRTQRWRRTGWAMALAIILMLAAPWYIRNANLTGNPLFPIDVTIAGRPLLRGLFATTRSAAMQTPSGILDVLVGGQGYYGPPKRIAIVLVMGWLAALVMTMRRTMLREPLWRACLLGSVLSIGVFVAAAPYAEVRFVYPALALLFAAAAGAAARIPRGGDLAVAGGFALLVLADALSGRQDLQGFALVGVVVTAIVTSLYVFSGPRHVRRVGWATAALATIVLAGFAYVNWRAYLESYAAGRIESWTGVRGDIAAAWGVVDRDVPPGSVVAYANTHFVYPLQGSRLANRVVYLPSRRGIHAIRDLPRAAVPLADEQIPAYFAGQAQQQADFEVWADHLKASGADFLFIARSGPSPPPELAFVARQPAAFELIHDDPAAALYRIRDAALSRD